MGSSDTARVSAPGAGARGCAAAHGAGAALEGDHEGQQLVGRQQAGGSAQAAARRRAGVRVGRGRAVLPAQADRVVPHVGRRRDARARHVRRQPLILRVVGRHLQQASKDLSCGPNAPQPAACRIPHPEAPLRN